MRHAERFDVAPPPLLFSLTRGKEGGATGGQRLGTAAEHEEARRRKAEAAAAARGNLPALSLCRIAVRVSHP